MRKIMISILLFTAFINCNKNDLSNLKYVETIPGGCALDKANSQKNIKPWRDNTVTYTSSYDSLNIFVGFNATCCGQYNPSSKIKGDSILIEILTTQAGLCDCICYYTYNFKFSGCGNSFKYHIKVDDYLNFTGQIVP
jgi:hypothetical protein